MQGRGARASGAAFTILHVWHEGLVFARIDEVLRPRLVDRHLLEIGEGRARPGGVDAREERNRGFARLAFALVQTHQTIDRFRYSSRRDLCRETAERGLFSSRVAADHDEVLRQHAIAELADAALQAYPGDVMLSAAIGAAADLDAQVPCRVR